MLDFNTLTGNEIALIEDLSGLSLDAIGNPGAPKAKLLATLVLISKRREGVTDFKFNDAMDMPIAEMTAYLGMDAEVEDDSEEGKDGSSEPPAPKSKRRS